METELVTTALHQVTLFGWWWLLVPVIVGVLMVVVGLAVDDALPLAGIGFFVLFLGTLAVAAINVSGPAYDADLLRSDVAEQLQVEETVKDGEWYLGKGPDGEFVRFALVEQDGAEDTYAVLVEK